MRTRTKIALVAGSAAVLVAIGSGLVIASSGDDQPLSGTALERATKAALAHTGGGTVIETEVGDDGAAYGVEIRLEDGRVVEVALDADFDVVASTADDDGAETEESGDTED